VKYLKKPSHSLQTTDDAKINTILEWRKNDNSTSDEAFPIRNNGVPFIRRHDRIEMKIPNKL
jgi:hypothetical protein